MTDDDWQAGFAKSLGVFLNGDALPDPDRARPPARDDSFLLLFNAHHERRHLRAARQEVGPPLGCRADHGHRPGRPPDAQPAGAKVTVAGRSVQVLRRI